MISACKYETKSVLNWMDKNGGRELRFWSSYVEGRKVCVEGASGVEEFVACLSAGLNLWSIYMEHDYGYFDAVPHSII